MPLIGADAVLLAIAETKARRNAQLRVIYLQGLGKIMIETPVDEGRARNSWFMTVGMPFTLSTGRSGDTSGSGSLSSLATMPDYVLNKKIYYSNNLPYIYKLEYGGYPVPSGGSWDVQSQSYDVKTINGFSDQAPSGFARKGLLVMRQAIRNL